MSEAEPTFDGDGYPTEETLERIKAWPIATFADCAAAMDFAGSAWCYHDYWKCIERLDDPVWPGFPRRVYRFSTCGWSGNESIVAAIEANQMLQMLGAWSWQRGGHYEYRFPIGAEVRNG